MKFYRLLHIAAFLTVSIFVSKAQNPPQTPEEQQKQLLEYIDKEVKRLSSSLELEYWQEFYVDSTLTHDLNARMEEIQEMQRSKVGNADLYQAVSDKWMEQIDKSYKRFFTKEQWDKYWKQTGKRAQKDRDKRKQK